MKKYIADLIQELVKQNVVNKEIEEIIANYEELISNAQDKGLSNDEIRKKLGNPKKVAMEIAADATIEAVEQQETQGFTLWKTFFTTSDTLAIDVGLLNEDIYYQMTDSNEIGVYYEGSINLDKYHLSYKNEKLRLENPKTSIQIFNVLKKKVIRIIIEIPKGLIVSNFKHKSVSSDIYIRNIVANQTSLTTVSGDVEIYGSNLGDTKSNSVSADFKISTSKFESYKVSQVSGDIELRDSKFANYLHVNSVSGDVIAKKVVCNDYKHNSVSGDLDGTEFYPQKLSFTSVSGDVTIKNNEKNTILVKKTKSATGDTKID